MKEFGHKHVSPLEAEKPGEIPLHLVSFKKRLLRLMSIAGLCTSVYRYQWGVNWFTRAIMIFLAICATKAEGQSELEMSSERYAKAERFLPWNVTEFARNVEFEPHWIEADPEFFWYRRDSPKGWEYRLVNAKTGVNKSAFEHSRLAAVLPEGIVDSNRLEVLSITGSQKTRQIELRTKEGLMLCELATYQCVFPNPTIIAGSKSPDDEWYLTRSGGQLELRHKGEEDSVRLAFPNFNTSMRENAQWAPNGKAFLVEFIDRSLVENAPLIASLNDQGRPAPHLIPFNGGTRSLAEAPRLRFAVVTRNTNLATKPTWRVVPIHLEATGWSSAISGRQVFWSDDGTRLFILLASRDGTRLTLWQINPATGSAERVIEEESKTGMFWNLHWAGDPNVRLAASGDRVIWFSERDGKGQLWLYSLDGSTPPRQITRGNFVVRDLLWTSEDASKLFVTIAGFDKSDDPYHQMLVQVDVQTGEILPLTSATADHAIKVSPTGQHFVDVTSGFDRETTMSLHQADGALISVVETSDLSRLKATGWSWPVRERISIEGAPGDIYATILFPSSFDSSAQYPIVECLYPIPDGRWAPIRLGEVLLNRFTHAQAVANLGFLVVFIDAPGSGLRSRAFRAGSRGNLHSVGLDFRPRVLNELASRYPQMDLSRVGVYGNSGGANATVRALLEQPDVYHVAVASGGNHDLRFGGPWVERHQGLRFGTSEQESNVSLAARLKGRLLLVHGALDRVVHHAQTLALAQGFIEANRDVDVLLLPNRGHDVMNDPYFIRRMWDHLVEHLQDRRPPLYQITPLPEWMR